MGVSLQEDTCTGPTASFFGKGASSTYGKHQVNLNVNDFLDAPVRLKYSYLTVLPQGLQDNGGGYLDGNLISVGGFAAATMLLDIHTAAAKEVFWTMLGICP